MAPTNKTMCPEVESASESEYQGFSWGKGGWRIWLKTYHPCKVKKSGALTYLEPLGPPRPVAGHLYCTFTLPSMMNITSVYYEM